MKPKIGDFIIAFLVLSFALLLSYYYISKANTSENLVAVISQNGKIIQAINLSEIKAGETKSINIDGTFSAIITAQHNKIRFESSSCPDKVCVHTGWLTKKGQSAVCLPNKIIIKIQGKKSDVDIIVK